MLTSVSQTFSFPRSHITHLYLSIFAKGRKYKLELIPALPTPWQNVQFLKTDKHTVSAVLNCKPLASCTKSLLQGVATLRKQRIWQTSYYFKCSKRYFYSANME